MTARRRLLAAASATFALAALTACEKPAPLVTVVSGGESVYAEAVAFCFDEGSTLDSGTCATRHEGATRLSVRAGDKIGVDVDKELTDRSWQLTLVDPNSPDSPQTSPTIVDNHYFSFTAPGLAPGGRLMLVVQTLDPAQQPTGEWQFELIPRA
ncbi:MAG: hypothetical protein WD794_05690 [Mycobacteriales bacterium]